MPIPLTPEQQSLVDAIIARGDYASPEEVVDEALRQLERRMVHEAAEDAAIAEGIAAAERGDLHDGEKVMREIRAKLLRRKAAEQARQG